MLPKFLSLLKKGFDVNDDYRPPRSLRLVPQPPQTQSLMEGRVERHDQVYNILDSAAEDWQHPIGSVRVSRKTYQPSGTVHHEASFSGDWQKDNGLGVQGLKAVAGMIAKMHPELKEFAVSRQKAGVRRAKANAPITGTSANTAGEKAKASVANLRSQYGAGQDAERALEARGISPYTDKRHPNPYAAQD